ncbi:divergent PAP2 family protein [Clostridiaceae bacterium HSG29]|nr:divergent PAP2 family protein [Clostridiaceae bacterium HSG29]
MNYFIEVFGNDILFSGFIAWLIAQVLKIFTDFYKNRKMDVTRIVGSGGMPSSHSSLVMGLSTAVGLKHGWGSDLYVISLIFSLIVMYDASGVRRAVGKQASLLNRIIKDLYKHKRILEGELKELVGHTPKEVFAGAILGIIVANYYL